MTTRDDTYPDPDLVTAYRTSKRSKTAHIDQGDGKCGCGAQTAEMIETGWLRQTLRQGLEICPQAALSAAEEE